MTSDTNHSKETRSLAKSDGPQPQNNEQTSAPGKAEPFSHARTLLPGTYTAAIDPATGKVLWVEPIDVEDIITLDKSEYSVKETTASSGPAKRAAGGMTKKE